MLVLKYMSRQTPSIAINGLFFTKLKQVLTILQVAEHYRDIIVYRDNLLSIIELYRDITFSIIAQPYFI